MIISPRIPNKIDWIQISLKSIKTNQNCVQIHCFFFINIFSIKKKCSEIVWQSLIPECTWMSPHMKYPITRMKFSWTTKSLCWFFQTTIGIKKNLPIFAKHTALVNKPIGLATDWNNVDFFRLKLSSAINTKLSEINHVVIGIEYYFNDWQLRMNC